jgi:hypothetical protein
MSDLTPFERELLDYLILKYGSEGFSISLAKEEFAKAMGCNDEATNLTHKGYLEHWMGTTHLTEKAFKENENGHE